MNIHSYGKKRLSFRAVFEIPQTNPIGVLSLFPKYYAVLPPKSQPALFLFKLLIQESNKSKKEPYLLSSNKENLNNVIGKYK